MKMRKSSSHGIASLRELRNLRHANETAKKAAAERVKSGVAGVLSLSGLLVSLAQHYAPASISRIIGRLFQFSKQ